MKIRQVFYSWRIVHVVSEFFGGTEAERGGVGGNGAGINCTLLSALHGS